jgi:hypothetical protein
MFVLSGGDHAQVFGIGGNAPNAFLSDHEWALMLLSGWSVSTISIGNGSGNRDIENDAGRAGASFLSTRPRMLPIRWKRRIANTWVDRVNLAYGALPDTFTNVGDLLAPELQACGIHAPKYAPMARDAKNYLALVRIWRSAIWQDRIQLCRHAEEDHWPTSFLEGPEFRTDGLSNGRADRRPLRGFQ